MRIDIITVLPALLAGPLDHSIIKRARDKGVVEIHIHDLRDFSHGQAPAGWMIMLLAEMQGW